MPSEDELQHAHNLIACHLFGLLPHACEVLTHVLMDHIRKLGPQKSMQLEGRGEGAPDIYVVSGSDRAFMNATFRALVKNPETDPSVTELNRMYKLKKPKQVKE